MLQKVHDGAAADEAVHRRDGPGELWSAVLAHLRTRVPRDGYDTWLAPTRARSVNDDIVDVEVPNSFFADWLGQHYAPDIRAALAALTGRNMGLRLRPKDSGRFGQGQSQPDSVGHVKAKARSAEPPQHRAESSRLLARYTFDGFVVGESNRLAAAAARNVAERPGAAYNPLFIYGGVGLGKTHLLQAIGNHCLATHRAVRVHYAAAETVFIELIQAIERNSRLEFKSRYRGLNVLLLDDIHYLIGKERLQEEIFHIFNYLHDAGSQIVFTSDRPPRDIPTLEERLISRLGSGLVVDIQPPDIETRSAILMRRAAQEHVELPEDVRLYIAHRIKTNVRALEGSLVRLMAMASLEARPLTVPLAEAALRDIVPQEPQIDQNRVLSVVADHYQVPVSEICGTRRTKQLALARQVAMHQMRSLLAYSLKEIGHHCGRRDHSTVIHGIAKIERLRTQDPAFAAKLTSISTKIGKR